MILKIIRWIYGYVLFIVKGGNIEKFINLSVKRRVNFWGIRRSGDILYSNVIAREYKELHKVSKQTKSRIRVKKKYGLPFIINKYRFRLGFFLGIFLYMGIIYVLSLYIWNIKVTGNENISSEEILEVMSELGVSSGTLKSHIDVPLVNQYAMIKLPGISWISINISGSFAEISVKEKAITPEVVAEDRPCNIKANFDGQIERIETYKGTCVVGVGDAVVKGQLLINGVVEDYFGSNTFVHADGKVFARTRRKFSEEIMTSKIQCMDTGKVINRYKVKILGVEIPFRLWENTDDTYRVEIENYKLNLFGVNLPISIYSERWYEQICDIKEVSFEEAKKEAIDSINVKCANEFSSVQILEENDREFDKDGLRFVEVEYICIEDIGNKEEILFE